MFLLLFVIFLLVFGTLPWQRANQAARWLELDINEEKIGENDFFSGDEDISQEQFPEMRFLVVGFADMQS